MSDIFCTFVPAKYNLGSPMNANAARSVGKAEADVYLFRAPADFNLWEEEETQPLHLLPGNLIMDCRFRRSGAVLTAAISLPNAQYLCTRLALSFVAFTYYLRTIYGGYTDDITN